MFSRHDAGWLHVFRSTNRGDPAAASWDDLNLPARMATLAAAGLPMIQARNDGSTVAIQTVGKALGIGLFHEDAEDLGSTLRDGPAMAGLRSNVARHRAEFTFDGHADRLIPFLRQAIAAAATRRRPHRRATTAAEAVVVAPVSVPRPAVETPGTSLPPVARAR